MRPRRRQADFRPHGLASPKGVSVAVPSIAVRSGRCGSRYPARAATFCGCSIVRQLTTRRSAVLANPRPPRSAIWSLKPEPLPPNSRGARLQRHWRTTARHRSTVCTLARSRRHSEAEAAMLAWMLGALREIRHAWRDGRLRRYGSSRR